MADFAATAPVAVDAQNRNRVDGDCIGLADDNLDDNNMRLITGPAWAPSRFRTTPRFLLVTLRGDFLERISVFTFLGVPRRLYLLKIESREYARTLSFEKSCPTH